MLCLKVLFTGGRAGSGDGHRLTQPPDYQRVLVSIGRMYLQVPGADPLILTTSIVIWLFTSFRFSDPGGCGCDTGRREPCAVTAPEPLPDGSRIPAELPGVRTRDRVQVGELQAGGVPLGAVGSPQLAAGPGGRHPGQVAQPDGHVLHLVTPDDAVQR